jgi:hypothetical protein
MATIKIINGFSLTSLFKRPSHLCKGKILLMMFLVSAFINVKCQNTMDYSVQANIIYHFTKYINWPENHKSGDFIIGVIGETPLFDELKKIIVSKKALNRKIVIRHFSPSQTTYDCHILFLSEEESGSLNNIASRTENNSVLLVCEEEGTASRGACISFNVVSEHLKLEINKNNIDQRNLSIANELLHLGTLVK